MLVDTYSLPLVDGFVNSFLKLFTNFFIRVIKMDLRRRADKGGCASLWLALLALS